MRRRFARDGVRHTAHDADGKNETSLASSLKIEKGWVGVYVATFQPGNPYEADRAKLKASQNEKCSVYICKLIYLHL